MKLLLVNFTIVMVANALSDEHQWQVFKQNNGKSYRSLVEEKTRFNIFQSNLRLIDAHNERFAKGEVTYKKGITVFTDITDEEFRSFLTPFEPEISGGRTARFNFNWTNPKSINWTAKGAVGKPMFIGDCNCSYADAAAGAIGARLFRKYNEFQQLSVQHLIDCSSDYGNHGCTSGNYNYAFNYVKKYGILLESEYPFVGYKQNCKQTGGVKIRYFFKVPSIVFFMQLSVANSGPICASMNMKEDLKLYESGIIDKTFNCRNDLESLNHAALIVGYGVENGQKYWICRNSWSTQWGENGYFRIKKGSDNVCGINLMPSFPVLY